MADLEDLVAIFSIVFLCFRFLSLTRLRQSLFLLMRTTQISKAVFLNMMIISCGLQSFSIAVK